MRGRGKAGVAAAASAATGDDDALVGMREIVDALAGIFVVENRAHWDLQHDVSTLGAGLVGAFAVTAASGLVFGIKAEVHQRVVALAGFHPHVAAAAAVAPPWTPARNEPLTPAGHASLSAVAASNL